jgi:hypothetical protein
MFVDPQPLLRLQGLEVFEDAQQDVAKDRAVPAGFVKTHRVQMPRPREET